MQTKPQVEFYGTLNVQVFFETLAKILGKKNGVEIEVVSIKRRDQFLKGGEKHVNKPTTDELLKKACNM